MTGIYFSSQVLFYIRFDQLPLYFLESGLYSYHSILPINLGS